MRAANIIYFSIITIGFLAMLLPPGLDTRAAIIFVSMAIGGLTSICQIINHNTGYPGSDWCVPIGIPAGAVAGTTEYLAVRARKRGSWDVTGDLSNLWERMRYEMSTQGPRIWCEMTAGRWKEEKLGGQEEL